MNGKIIINNLEQYGNIGLSEEEKTIKQKILLNIELEFEIEKLGNDNIENTINYVEICDICKESMKKKYNLIETIAYTIVNEIKLKFPNIKTLKLSIKKPQVQLNAKLDSVEFVLQF